MCPFGFRYGWAVVAYPDGHVVIGCGIGFAGNMSAFSVYGLYGIVYQVDQHLAYQSLVGMKHQVGGQYGAFPFYG